jgi:hypothetical protein
MSTVNQAAPPPPAVRLVLPALLEPLPPNTPETCDRCGPGTTAATTVILPSGGLLTLCGHHARPFGYEHPQPEYGLIGSDR